jgi:hypothetical protein
VQQASAIHAANNGSVFALHQALYLWQSARKDKEVSAKSLLLANIPCSSHKGRTASSEHYFRVKSTAPLRLVDGHH